MLGFTYPLLLSCLPLALAGIWFAYRAGGSAEKKFVPSLLFLRKYAGVTKTQRKFIPPLRAFLFALIAICLAGVSAGIYTKDAQPEKIILIDNSFGSAVIQNDTRSALDYLREAALSAVSENTKIYALCPRLREIDKSQLKSLAAGYCESPLSDALLSELPTDGHLTVYTKRALLSSQAQPFLEVRNAGTQPKSNLALSDARYDNTKGFKKVKVELTSYASEKTKAALELFALQDSRWQSFGKQDFEISPQQVLSLELPLPSVLNKPVKVQLQAARAVNALTLDDQWYLPSLNAKGTGRQKIGVLSPLSIEVLGLASINDFEFEQVTLAALKEKPSYDGLIVHRQEILPRDLDISSIAIMSGKLTEKDSVNEITRFNGTHPILSYVSARTLQIPQSYPENTKQEGGESILSTSKGSLLSILEKKRGLTYIRNASVYFELLPFEAAKTPSSSIVLLNMLRWVFSSPTHSGGVRPYQKVEELTDIPQQPEIYFGSKNQEVAVNFYDARESNTLEPAEWGISSSPLVKKEVAQTKTPPTYIIKLLLLLVLSVLLLERVLQNPMILQKLRRKRA